MSIIVDDEKTEVASLAQEISTQVLVDGRKGILPITVVGQDHRDFIPDRSNHLSNSSQYEFTASYTLQLWDNNHGFTAGQAVMLRICRLDCDGIDLFLKGVVQRINECGITVPGSDRVAECYTLVSGGL